MGTLYRYSTSDRTPTSATMAGDDVEASVPLILTHQLEEGPLMKCSQQGYEPANLGVKLNFVVSPCGDELESNEQDALDYMVKPMRLPNMLVEKLYEREAQQRDLQAAYCRLRAAQRSPVADASPEAATAGEEAAEFCLITGNSGTGKSRLARSLHRQVEQDGGFFIEAKFDRLQIPTRPFATLDDAFHGLILMIKAQPKKTIRMIRESAQKALGAEAALLVESLPSLRELLEANWNHPSTSPSTEDDESRRKTGDAQKRLSMVFRRFLMAVASPERPLVLFLDDLQWACPSSLELLKTVLENRPVNNDREQTPHHECCTRGGLLILGTCRGHEVAFGDPLSVMLRQLEDSGRDVTEIKVQNLSRAAVCQMVADCLRVQVTLKVEKLGDQIYQQTKGNVMFALEYLRSLQEDGLIFRDANGAWAWDSEEVTCPSTRGDESDETSGSLVSLLENKLRRLPATTQEALKVASCLGAEFDGAILKLAASLSDEQYKQVLVQSEELGCTKHDTESGGISFTHDKFLEASYSLIPDDQKATFHYQIANTLAVSFSPDEFSENLLLIVNHAIQGSTAIESFTCRCKLAGLCLDAGRVAAKSSDFAAAAHYFESGIKELQSALWNDDQYMLSIHLHNAAAEVAFCVGDHDKAAVMLQAIKQNARRFEDKLQAYSTELLCCLALERHVEAKTLAIPVLKKLGERFPSKTGVMGVIMDFMKTKRALRGKSDRQILNLPQMTDIRALGLMSILHNLYAHLLRSEVALAPLIGFRMVRITLRHGLSPLSCIGFGIFSSVLSRTGMVDDAVRYGQLALVLMDKYPSSGFACDTLCTVWGDALPHSIPLRDCLEPIQESYRLGLTTGSTSAAMIAGFVHCALTFCLGEPLSSLEAMAIHYRRKCLEYGQLMMIDFLLVMLQTSYNLRGLSEKSPLIITGSVMVEQEMIEKNSKQHFAIGYQWVYMIKFFLAVFLNEFEEANSLSSTLPQNMDAVVLPFLGTIHTFHEGLTAAILSPRSWKLRSVARCRLKRLRSAAKRNPESFKNKVFLLEAELARASGDINGASILYEESIKLAAKERYLHEQALACERAGRMFLDHNKPEEGRRYLGEARAIYSQWGATIKVEQVERLMLSPSDMSAPA